MYFTKCFCERFFEAIDLLKNRRVLGGLCGFAKKYNVVLGNLYTIKARKGGAVKAEYLHHLVRDYGMSKSILHKIMLYAEIAESNKRRRREGKPEDFSYIWHISYYLTRYMKRSDIKKEVCDFCKNLRDHELSGAKGRNLQLLALAARWAELELKFQY